MNAPNSRRQDRPRMVIRAALCRDVGYRARRSAPIRLPRRRHANLRKAKASLVRSSRRSSIGRIFPGRVGTNHGAVRRDAESRGTGTRDGRIRVARATRRHSLPWGPASLERLSDPITTPTPVLGRPRRATSTEPVCGRAAPFLVPSCDALAALGSDSDRPPSERSVHDLLKPPSSKTACDPGIVNDEAIVVEDDLGREPGSVSEPFEAD